MVTLTAEQRGFLRSGTLTGKLATVRKDGRPHVVPLWFVLDEDTIIFNTGDSSVKAANMRQGCGPRALLNATWGLSLRSHLGYAIAHLTSW